ncbi:kinase [Fusarium beomiforme]|uniref:Kinase n=1 Tax=Fusarium beomiforme TaxID=44412 RepID=A0A9P5DVK5_9HYPO|nr:kinase [Fusarium beomiforme]
MQQTRCLIHIGDAPPRGHTLHDYNEQDDRYYRTASDPNGLAPANLLSCLIGLKVSCTLLPINGTTDRMALEFGKVYSGGLSGANVKLHNKNAYNPMAEDSLVLARPKGSNEDDQHWAYLTAIVEDASVASTVTRKDVVLETAPPRWDAPGWLDKTLATNLLPIDFVTKLCLQDKFCGAKQDANLSLETFIEGECIKYNSNGIYILDDDSIPCNETAQAFSHSTFERSWGHFLVTDLQGVGNSSTDPATHTKDPEQFKLGETNLGENGFKFFFALHECKTCRELGLLTNREMLISGELTLRSTWPAMDPTGCCSNKLCHRIIRLATANKSLAYPEHNWCDSCFPQLKSTEAKLSCTTPESNHSFQVSKFYHESQDEETPTVCEDHRENDTTTETVVGGGLWDTTKSTKKGGTLGRLW